MVFVLHFVPLSRSLAGYRAGIQTSHFTFPLSSHTTRLHTSDKVEHANQETHLDQDAEYRLDDSIFPSLFFMQLPHTILDNTAFWEWAESSVLEGARKLEKLCHSVQDELNAPIVQVSPNTEPGYLSMLYGLQHVCPKLVLELVSHSRMVKGNVLSRAIHLKLTSPRLMCFR